MQERQQRTWKESMLKIINCLGNRVCKEGTKRESTQEVIKKQQGTMQESMQEKRKNVENNVCKKGL